MGTTYARQRTELEEALESFSSASTSCWLSFVKKLTGMKSVKELTQPFSAHTVLEIGDASLTGMGVGQGAGTERGLEAGHRCVSLSVSFRH